MPTQFDTFVNNAYATLASPYTAGSGSLALATGEGARFGSTFPICVTVITAATYRTTAETLAIYTVTGRSTDTLTGVSVAESTTDRSFLHRRHRRNAVHRRGGKPLLLDDQHSAECELRHRLQRRGKRPLVAIRLRLADYQFGTLALTAASGQTANQVLATSNGSSGALAVRALAAADMPASVVLSSGTYSQPAWLTSILGSIVSGNITGNAASISGSITTSQISNLSSWAGSTSITTLGTIATGTVPQANVSGLNSALALLAPLASPTFTGSVTLPSGTVTLAEHANLAAQSLIGNPTGSPAAPSAITLGAGLSFSGTTLVGQTGTVTSISWTGDGTIFTASADTPVTTSGTLAPTSLISQTANNLLAGPASGSSAAPTFRALVAADLPLGQHGDRGRRHHFRGHVDSKPRQRRLPYCHAGGRDDSCLL